MQEDTTRIRPTVRIIIPIRYGSHVASPAPCRDPIWSSSDSPMNPPVPRSRIISIARVSTTSGEAGDGHPGFRPHNHGSQGVHNRPRPAQINPAIVPEPRRPPIHRPIHRDASSHTSSPDTSLDDTPRIRSHSTASPIGSPEPGQVGLLPVR